MFHLRMKKKGGKMQALKQEVYIQENHQLNIKIPDTIPAGKTELLLVFQPSSSPSDKTKTKNLLEEFKDLKMKYSNLSADPIAIDITKITSEMNNAIL